MERPFYKRICLLGLLVLLTACGTSPTPTAIRPVPSPAATPSPPAAAYFAEIEYKFADEAEKALLDLNALRNEFVAYASWTNNSRLYFLVRDNSIERLRNKIDKTARIYPINYLAEPPLGTARGPFYVPSYMMILSRAVIDVKSGGAKEAAQILYSRAVAQLGNQPGLTIFTVGDDQIYVLIPSNSSTTPERVMSLASIGKLEVITSNSKVITNSTIINTSSSPLLGNLKLKESTVYETIASGSDFTNFGIGYTAGRTPLLSFELRNSSKIFEYTRANLGKQLALVFDRQVLATNTISTPVKDKIQIYAARWNSIEGTAELRHFVEILNVTPSLLFEAKEISSIRNLITSGNFIH